MGYKQPNNPMKMMKSALKMHKAEKKAGMHRDSAMYMNHSAMNMGHSPMEMGHSPMEMGHESPAKKYDSPMNKESRELKDMPIVDIEKGDAKGSPAKAAKPDYIDIDGDGDKSESMKDAAKDKKGSPAMKKQGYNDRLDESLAKDGDEDTKKQSMKDRRDESKGMEKAKGKGAYSSDPGMSRKSSPAAKYDEVVLGGNKGDKSKTKPGKKDYEGKGSPAKISARRAERKAKKGKGFISQRTGGTDTERRFHKLTNQGKKEMKETGMVSGSEIKKGKKIKE